MKDAVIMRSEDRLLLACTRQSFTDAHRQAVLDICRREEIAWDVVHSTAKHHGVAPLVYANLRQCISLGLDIPRDVVDRFRRSYHRNVVWKERSAERLMRALAFFRRKSIDVMLIKGAALDILVYDQPWYTVPHDVDIVIRPRRGEIPDETNAEIMQFLHRTGIEYDYFEHHDVVMNGALPLDFHKIWDDAVRIKFGGQDVFVMSPEDMLMSLCVNSCRKRFFRLKSLCDIAETSARHPGLKWEELTHRARAHDYNNILYTALLVTEMTLGCELPEGLLDNLQVSPTRAAVISYLVRRLSERCPLDALYPFSGRRVFGREANLAVLLPYVTYRPYQAGRKIQEAYRAWRLQD